jgi:hypothetical protein
MKCGRQVLKNRVQFCRFGGRNGFRTQLADAIFQSAGAEMPGDKAVQQRPRERLFLNHLIKPKSEHLRGERFKQFRIAYAVLVGNKGKSLRVLQAMP